MSGEKTQCAVCGEFRFNWELRQLPFHDAWVCKEHPDSEVEKKLKREKDERRYDQRHDRQGTGQHADQRT